MRLSTILAGLSPPGAARRVLDDDLAEAGDQDLLDDDLAEAVGFDHHDEVAIGPAPAARHLVVLGVVCGIVLVILGCRTLSARGHVLAAGQPEPNLVSASPVPAWSPSEPAALVVHVVGEVEQPGVVELPAGARVRDAIAACGGFTDQADSALLNLAAPLNDGVQIVVGSLEDPRGEINGGSSGADPDSGLVNLNTADDATLQSLPGVGPVMAQAIITWRQENGGFSEVDQLRQINGVGDKTYAKLAPLVTV